MISHKFCVVNDFTHTSTDKKIFNTKINIKKTLAFKTRFYVDKRKKFDIKFIKIYILHLLT